MDNVLALEFFVHSRCCEFFERPVHLPDFTTVTAKQRRRLAVNPNKPEKEFKFNM